MLPPWIDRGRSDKAAGRPLVAPPPHLVPYGPDPLHRQVAAYIKTLIETGVWPPGGRLKAELRLAEDFTVSRGTLKKALAILVSEGLITQVHGRGTFVSVPPAAPRDDLVHAIEAFTGDGEGAETVQLSTYHTTMPEEVAQALESAPGAPVVKITALRRDQDGPLGVIVRWARLDVGPPTQGMRHPADDGDREKAPGQRRLCAVAADEETAGLLDVPAGAPVQYLEEIAHEPLTGAAAELCQVWTRSDRVVYGFTLEPARHEPAGSATIVLGAAPERRPVTR
ncbi:GntR family transcriptional regulator [Thermomonospora umbrina]|uniref:GntR family transcriptional regulator n=1 Tax=Thermomonospora umbrina TaxID=111806 RepID=A0A3D9SS38_9ACTN|nr:GntR family transcriptional regulator [Thermomonospora umbrina]REE98776.1 GntR family transcriptional regulator [Thermomonospora umbrina]